MVFNFGSAGELKHPGFILFEGLDFTGKTTLSRIVASSLKGSLGLNIKYNHNEGLIREGLADSNLVSHMDSRDKSRYFLDLYIKDVLPSNPADFSEIVQDRHSPSIMFYSVATNNLLMGDINFFINQYAKPKYIFLVECSHEEKLRRSEVRTSLTTLEKKILSSKVLNDKYQSIYREIINAFGVPSSIVDSTELSEEELAELCTETIKNHGVLEYAVPVDSLFADFEPRVYPETAGKSMQKLEKGLSLSPIVVANKIDTRGRYARVIIDGRHRAYAAWKTGCHTMSAYVNYESVENIDSLGLTHISEFRFK